MYWALSGKFNKVPAFYIWGLVLTTKILNDYLITDYGEDVIRVQKYFRRKKIFLFFEKMPFGLNPEDAKKSDMEERAV